MTKRKRAPCRCCGKVVARVLYGGLPGNGLRGEVTHKCPHGKPCRAGMPLYRHSHISYVPGCTECNAGMQERARAQRTP